MKQKLLCLCVASLFAFVMANVSFAQPSMAPAAAPAAENTACPCAQCVKMVQCKCAAVCNPCCNPCGYYTYPYYYGYPYYGYRVGLFGCVRPAFRPYYWGYAYPYGYCW